MIVPNKSDYTALHLQTSNARRVNEPLVLKAMAVPIHSFSNQSGRSFAFRQTVETGSTHAVPTCWKSQQTSLLNKDQPRLLDILFLFIKSNFELKLYIYFSGEVGLDLAFGLVTSYRRH